MDLQEWAERARAALTKRIAQTQARAWSKSYHVSFAIRSALRKRRLLIIGMFAVFVAIAAAFISLRFQAPIYAAFKESGDFANLRTFLITLGASLLGATAIGFSFVMFAMQVNVERMPHGLFRRFSKDPKLMGSFAATFMLAIANCASGLIPSANWASAAIVGTAASCILIFILLIYSYGRALSLINPGQQLSLVISTTQRHLTIWDRRPRRARPLLISDDPEAQELPNDMARVVYFRANPTWSASAYQGLRYAMAFAGRYAARADYEVTAAALQTVIAVNALYVSAKGKIFFTDNGLFNHPMSSDGFINETLEALRQAVASAISTDDEQYLEQLMRTLENLVSLYDRIDYARDRATPKHAQLAAGYLFGAVEAVLPRNKTDAVMEGVRAMGRAAQALLAQSQTPMNVVATADKLGPLAAACSIQDKTRPVTLSAVEQLAKLTFDILRTDCWPAFFLRAHRISYGSGGSLALRFASVLSPWRRWRS